MAVMLSNGMRATVFCVLFVAALEGWSSVSMVAADASLPNCTPTLVKLQGCLPYVQGQATAPTSGCCTSVLDIHKNNPACLCVLAEDNNTTRAIPDYRLDLAGQLPTVCRIEGASITNCPALLGQTTNGTAAPTASPGGTANGPAPQDTGAAFRLSTSANAKEFILKYLVLILASSAVISFVK